MVWTTAVSMLAVAALAVVTGGWVFVRATWLERAICVPAAALLLYLYGGHPDMPAAPLSARIAAAEVRTQQDDARIALKEIAVGTVDPADDAGGRVAAPFPRDDVEGGKVRHQEHVALGDPGEPGDRRAIEPLAMLDDIPEEVDRDRHELGNAHHISELEIDELDRLALAGFQYLLDTRRFGLPAGRNYFDCHPLPSRPGHTLPPLSASVRCQPAT
jgi:hypothetical protein